MVPTKLKKNFFLNDNHKITGINQVYKETDHDEKKIYMIIIISWWL